MGEDLSPDLVTDVAEIISSIEISQSTKSSTSEKSSKFNSYGIKKEFVFNAIHQFHITENRSVDLMHDILEEVAHFDLGRILTYFIFVNKYFCLEDLNKRMNNFEHGDNETSTPVNMTEIYATTDKIEETKKNQIQAKCS